MNKKVINASPTKYRGIQFKSRLEVLVFKTLIENGIIPRYEKDTFILSPKVKSKVPFYNRTKVRGFHLMPPTIAQITYTPDFVFNYKGIMVIIEAKGKENDTFPIKKNLFRKLLETFKGKIIFFEVRSKKELLQALKILNDLDEKL